LRAVDTNILARYIMDDDAVQSMLANELLAEPCFVSDTVLVELAWLLLSRYGIKRAMLVVIVRDLLSLPLLEVSDASLILWAVDRFADGADFADMIHLIASRSADSFVSFDRSLSKDAGAESPILIEVPG
jgi:predicted nucleic-acid-binding protein